MAQKPAIPKGTRDFLPEVMLRREYIFQTIRQVFRTYGYAPIETPAMEKLSVLTGKYGEEGDRLIFKILNNGDFLKKARSLDDSRALSFEISERALRYDLTVPFARFVVMHQNELNFPFKRYQIQPVWRADRPQRGRYREFFQCDADVIGSDSLLFEAEFISMFDEVFTALNFPGVDVWVNNRKILQGYAELVGQPDKFVDICVAIDKLDKIGRDGVARELETRGVDAAGANKLFELIEFTGSNTDKLSMLKEAFQGCEIGLQGVAELEEVFTLLAQFEIKRANVEFNLPLARGLTYYTGAIFEVKAQGVPMGSICGGGRYADLTGLFGLKGMSGVGISFGADRIYDVMEALDLFPEGRASTAEVMLVHFPDTFQASLKVLAALRAAGIPAEMYPDSAKLKKQFSYADKQGIPNVLLIGADELETGTYKLRNMGDGSEQGLDLPALIAKLASR